MTSLMLHYRTPFPYWGRIPALIPFPDDAPDGLLGMMFVVSAGIGVVTVSPSLPFLRRMRLRLNLARAFYRYLDGTGTPYAWAVRSEAEDGLPVPQAKAA